MNSARVVFVPQGGINAIITHLQKSNIEISRFDGLLLRFFGRPQSGWLQIAQDSHKTSTAPSKTDIESKTDSIKKSPKEPQKPIRISRGDFLFALSYAKAATTQITLIPGETLHFFIINLAEKLSLNLAALHAEYKAIAPFSDGVILADSYNIPRGISERDLMRYLVQNSLKKHRALAEKFLGKYDQKQWFSFITKASIIQKEAANIAEMPLVSAVIENRLKIGMKLQMDGALNYGEFSHTKITPQMIKTDSTSYNTYRFLGLPKEPCGSVSLDAIKAALNPANVDYLYFVRGKHGGHNFSKTYNEHLKNFEK